MKTTILTLEDLRHIVRQVGLDTLMDEVIGGLEQAIVEFDEEVTLVPVREGFSYELPAVGLVEWMPLMRRDGPVMIKVVAYHPRNPEKRLPTILSTVSAYDTDSGHLIGLMDATFLTAVRTGAMSAVASRIMARPDSRTLGIIGCGAQAVTQVHALSRTFNIEELLFFDTDAAVVDSFPDRIQAFGHGIATIRSAPIDEIVSTSDVLCLSTSIDVGSGPVFDDQPTKPWVHINAVGSDFPGKIELPLALLKRSFVCPDFIDQAIREGECQQLELDEIGPSLVEVAQRPEAYSGLADRLTVFDSTGWALEDQVAMDILFGHARALELGSHLEIESLSGDAHNPYHGIADDPTESARLASIYVEEPSVLPASQSGQ